MSIPADLKYTNEHEWIRPTGNTARVGITRFAVDQLGDIVHIDLPTPGRVVKQRDPIASVESVKAVSDVYAPVSGKVVRVNLDLAPSPETINMDPYDGGWMIEIDPSTPAEIDALLSPGDYEKHVKGNK